MLTTNTTVKQDLLESAKHLEGDAEDSLRQAEAAEKRADDWRANAKRQRRKSAEYRKLAATLPE